MARAAAGRGVGGRDLDGAALEVRARVEADLRGRAAIAGLPHHR